MGHLVAHPGCVPVAALERFLLVLVIFDNAERHSREGLDIRTAKMREHDLESGSELVGNTLHQGKQRHRGLRRLLVNTSTQGGLSSPLGRSAIAVTLTLLA